MIYVLTLTKPNTGVLYYPQVEADSFEAKGGIITFYKTTGSYVTEKKFVVAYPIHRLLKVEPSKG